MKSFLITTSAPFCGTNQYYTAYGDDENTILDWLYENWFDEECQRLWDDYSFHCDDQWEDEWNEMDEDERDEIFEDNWDNFMDSKYEDWCSDCGMSIKEMDEEKLHMYTIGGGDGVPEIIYDDRNKE